MTKFLYATFTDPSDAKKAAGALMDYGVTEEDLTITSKHVPGMHPIDNGVETVQISTMTQSESLTSNLDNNDGSHNANRIALAKEYSQMIDNTQADIGYQEADKAERLAKWGISTTTKRDAVAGAIKGSKLGVVFGLVAGFIFALPLHETGPIGAMGVTIVVEVSIIGLFVGVIIGFTIGYLKDQGAISKAVTQPVGHLAGHPVLLALNVSSGHLGETEARRIITKYHATSIDKS